MPVLAQRKDAGRVWARWHTLLACHIDHKARLPGLAATY